MKKFSLLFFLLLPIFLFSQNEISLYQQFNGSFDFIAFGNTLNVEENTTGPCTILSSSSDTFMLGPGQTLKQAYLYWAGAGPADLDVLFNDVPITAQRTFFTGGYFSAFADVTSILEQNTTGQYTLSELDLDITGFCQNSTNFGGWSVIVVFEDPTLTITRQVSVFDGFQMIGEGSPLNIILNFLSITDANDARIGFLSWEGDAGISVTESMRINGNLLSNPPLNPPDNVFNGTNSYTGSNQLYNMDIDFFDISNYIQAGDESASITLTSGQDVVLINNVVAAYNSEVDLDAIIEIDAIIECGSGTISVDYTVTNQGTIGLLSANTPIAFYIDNNLVAQTTTTTFLSSNQSESGNIFIPIPIGTADTFILKAVVDDDGTGTGTVTENNENNNESVVSFTISTGLPDPIEYFICDNLNENDGIAEFDLYNPTIIDQVLGILDPANYDIFFHPTLQDAMADTNRLSSPKVNNENPQSLYARATEKTTKCFIVNEVILKVGLLPEFEIDSTYRLCVDALGEPLPAEEGSDSPPIINTGLDPTVYEFLWELDGVLLPTEINSSLVAVKGGEYKITVTDGIGCSTSRTTTVTVSSPPLVYDAQVITDAFSGIHNLEVTLEGLGDYIVKLDNGSFQDELIFYDVLPGGHTVTIKDKNGCGRVIIDNIAVIDYPPFFTPNEDGFHDTWNIIKMTAIDPNAKIYIFDRYGKLIKELSPFGPGWDGTYNGKALPSSDYWFRVEYVEKNLNKVFKNHFTLKR